VKDRIGNKLAMGQKVVVALPEAQIFGYVAQLEEGGLITGLKRGGAEKRLGRILVSCVIALPVDPEMDSVAQLVRVYDPQKPDEQGEGAAERPN
jgi:hypothetical protein